MQYDHERKRLATYAARSYVPAVPSILASAAGFVLTYSTDISHLRCPWCHLELKLLKTHSPIAWHRTYSSRCQFLLEKHDSSLDICPGALLTHDITASVVTDDTEDSAQTLTGSDAVQSHVTVQNQPITDQDATDGDDGRYSATAALRLYKKYSNIRCARLIV